LGDAQPIVGGRGKSVAKSNINKMKKFQFIHAQYNRAARTQKASYACIETGEVLISSTKTIFKKSSTQDVERYEINWFLSNKPVFVRVLDVQTIGEHPKQKGFLLCEIN
jgi:hypothetical protein